VDGCCVWLTGPAGAGKTTIGRAVVDTLHGDGERAELLDEREVRDWLGPLEGDARAELVRLARLAELLVRNGVIVVVAAIAPSRAWRDQRRAEIDRFVEVFVDTPAEVRADRLGVLVIPDEYEEPLFPEVRVVTHDRDAAASASQVLGFLEHEGLATAAATPTPR
jgi:adenylylsulfate kinase